MPDPLPPPRPLPAPTPQALAARAACDLIERVSLAGLAAESDGDLLVLKPWTRMLAPPQLLGDTREFDVSEIFDAPLTKLDVAPQAAHLCKLCHSFQSGTKLDERMWLCGGCRQVAPY